MNFESRIDLQELNDAITAIKAEIGKIIVGQQQTIELLLTAILADGHVLIEGYPVWQKPLPPSYWLELSIPISVVFNLHPTSCRPMYWGRRFSTLNSLILSLKRAYLLQYYFGG